MSTDDHWIGTRITEARKCHPLVTEAVLHRMEQVLKGQLSEQQLSQGGLTILAKALIADMDATSPKTEAKR